MKETQQSMQPMMHKMLEDFFFDPCNQGWGAGTAESRPSTPPLHRRQQFMLEGRPSMNW